MNVMEIGTTLVTMNNDGQEAEFVAQYYGPDIVSIEGQDSEELPGRLEGLDAVLGKHGWWYENNEVHSSTAEGPYRVCRPASDLASARACRVPDQGAFVKAHRACVERAQRRAGALQAAPFGRSEVRRRLRCASSPHSRCDSSARLAANAPRNAEARSLAGRHT